MWRSDFYRDNGSRLDSRYLAYLLGLETRYAVDPPDGLIDTELPNQAFRDAWMALSKEHKGVYCVPSVSVTPSWRGAKFEYLSTRDFQKAVYTLLCESWRAKLCRKCDKYFIAEKPAQVYCSTACSNRAGLESGRRYWHEKGTVLRERRGKKGGRSSKKEDQR
jgi:hypothetical protein